MIFGNTMIFELEFKLEKILGFRNIQEKLEKGFNTSYMAWQIVIEKQIMKQYEINSRSHLVGYSDIHDTLTSMM